ncbi:DUF4235 domain-containing protein [Longispora sp. K20-0274]|uniref:DUF4235 domain-containing protein n=1 Tax=Longispora sp. K20-0274 TaxID=3088255 RepID=UPI00399BED52
MRAKTLMYKPVGLVGGIAAGAVAGVAFKHVWRLVSGSDSAPDATDRRHGWVEVILAAAVQGAIFGVVKAAVDRAGARGFEKVAGTWPGEK